MTNTITIPDWSIEIDIDEVDPPLREFLEASYAEELGFATPLMRCYLCHLEETGKPDFDQRFDTSPSPLRGVKSTFTTNVRVDPTEAYRLTCGHTII
jgi:hypothetical protein